MWQPPKLACRVDRLSQSPEELLIAVADLLGLVDLRKLSEVSGILPRLTLPRLFDTLLITAPERALTTLDSKPYHKLANGETLECLKLVKHLRLQSDFHCMAPWRCPHTKLNYDGLALKLGPVLEQLEDDRLESFSWHLGTCIPKSIRGLQSYLY